MAHAVDKVRFTILATIFIFASATHAQRMTESKAAIRQVETDFAVADLDHAAWNRSEELRIGTQWDGSKAEDGRRFAVRMLWSKMALYIRFEAHQNEPLIASEKPRLSEKTMNLWDRDVCEIFIAPDREHPRKYFEFEIAPTGEWIDLAIDYTGAERKTDWNFRSGMESAARIEPRKVVMAVKIPWTAFPSTPKNGDTWLGNIFRCVGQDPTRGYLAWKPTMTSVPSFHVPEKFGEFVFVK